MTPDDPYMRDAIEYGKINGRAGKGTVMAWAAGNDYCDTSFHPIVKNEDIIVVSAVSQSGDLASYSVFGDDIDVAAPDASYTTTVGSGYTNSFGGTSAATPVTSGAIALMLSAAPNLSHKQALQCIKRAAYKDTSKSCSYGDWVDTIDDT